jgi:anhydro-N-acetylmuramic acid kinase
MLYIGMMSGTSLDGIDAVLVEITNSDNKLLLNTLAFASAPFSPSLLQLLQTLQRPCDDELHLSYLAANSLADAYALVAKNALLKANKAPHEVTAVGAHGQTVRHRPEHQYSVQLLNGARLAELTSVDVACDFRAADLAAGGEGAPLAPGFHAEIFSHPTFSRSIVNIGGIANVTWLAPSSDQPPVGFDTGPGNTLMDYWCLQNTGNAFDTDGAWASSASFNEALLQCFLSDSYFQRLGPKSTGRDLFHAQWLDQHLGAFPKIEANVVQATLLELTARTIADGINAQSVDEVYVCGGGAFNKALIARITALTAPAKLFTTSELGIDPQSVEALAFAWLAYKRVNLQPANLPSVTAAKGLRILGALHKTSAARAPLKR